MSSPANSLTEWKGDVRVDGKLNAFARIVFHEVPSRSDAPPFAFWYGILDVMASGWNEWYSLAGKALAIELPDGRTGAAQAIAGAMAQIFLALDGETPGQCFQVQFVGMSGLEIPGSKPRPLAERLAGL